MNALILEDDFELVLSWTKELKAKGFQVTTALEANEALEILAAERFDLLISDIFIRDSDGTILEGGGILLLGKMRTMLGKEHRPRTIAVTGQRPTQFSGVDLLVLAETLGADVVIRKPFPTRRLIDEVEKLFDL